MVVNPSAAMACAPKRKVPATIKMSLLIFDPRITEDSIVDQVGSSASSQLERGDAEHALETDGADRSRIHPRGLEDRCKPMILRERDRIASDAGHVEKDFARACRHQRCEHGFGRGAR